MAKIINTYTTATQFLTDTLNDNPATVTSSGTIAVASTNAFVPGLFGTSGFAWTLTNLGTVESIGSNGLGVLLQSGGLVTNGATGSTAAFVNATATAVQIEGTTSGVSGTVVNFGTIRAVSTNFGSNAILFFHSPSTTQSPVGTVTNQGTIIAGAAGTSGGAIGVQLGGGGTVVNSGLINAAYGQNVSGVASFSAGATVVNTGTILASGTTSGVGVNINSGSVNNSGLISGNSTGINIFSGVGTVVNTGTISATKVGITGTPFVTGVALGGGGTVINGTSGSSAGLITAYDVGISSFGTAGTATIVNFGTIQSTQTGTAVGSGFVGFGLQINRAATISNFGTISAAQTNGGGAILLQAGGSITNGASSSTTALITSPFQAINIFTSAGTITNFGTISKTGTVGGSAINLGAGGTIINGASASTAALITSPNTAISINGSAGTVTNFGTVISTSTGTNANAIFLGAGGTLNNYGLIAGGGTFNASVEVRGGTVNNFGTVTTTTNTHGVSLGAATTLTNIGTISSAGTSVSGVTIQPPGAKIVNGQTGTSLGLITAYHNGIQFFPGTAANPGTVTVVNYGTIQSTQTGTTGAGSGFGVQTGTNAATTISNFGTISAAQTNGGGAINLGAGGSITNGASSSTTALIAAPFQGISISGSAGTIANFGTISQTGTAGFQAIFIGAGGTITNRGTVSAAGTNASAVQFGTAGGRLVNGTLGGTLGLITGYHIGVGFFPNTAASPGTVTVVNYGTIQSTQTATVAGSLSGSAINFGTNGLGTIDNFGRIASSQTAGGVAIQMAGGVIINEAGATIDGKGGNAVTSLTAGVAVTLTNLGTVQNASTTNSTVYLGHGGIVTNGATGSTGATIKGTGTNGSTISIKSATSTVTNFGTIANAATFSSAVYLGAGGSVTNAASGTIIAPWLGVNLKNVAGTVRNLGTIESTATFTQPGTLVGGATTLKPVGVILQQGGVVINGTTGSTGGLIQSYGLGVYIGGGGGIPNAGATGTVVNYGTIASLGTGASTAPAVELSSGGTITNRGMITSVANNGVQIRGTVAGTVVNFGTVAFTGAGTSGRAVDLNSGGLLTNYGLLSGAATGSPLIGTIGGYTGVVRAINQPATVVNSGTITNPNNSNGVNLLAGGLLINGSTSATAALINAQHGGVYVGGTAGVPIPGAVGTVINYGTIQNSSTAAQAVRLVSGGTVTNHGLISSGRTGISFGNTAGTIYNFGTVISSAPTSFTAGAGIYLQSGGLITNAAGASITALKAAVSIGNTTTTTATVTISNSGNITGSIGIAIGAFDTGTNTIVNYGTIASTSGTGGIAIKLGAGDDRVVIEPGSSLVGAIGNFVPGDTIDLAAVSGGSAGTVSLAANNLLQVTEGGTTYNIQLDPAQNFAGETFHLSSDGGSGTLVSVTLGQPAPNDLNGDLKSDILWKNGTSTWLWEMNGTAQIGSGSAGVGGVGWSIAGTGDFNGDGKSDILWKNGTTNATWIWEMDGTVQIASGPAGVGGAGWSFAGTGDFNGDGKSDILWANGTTNATWIWEMNGTAQLGGSGGAGVGGAGWSIAGTGDFNGDGKSDILWANGTSTWIWEMNGTAQIASASAGVGGAGWSIAGTGDFNGDGKSDILWKNGTSTWIWLMDGTAQIGGGSAGTGGAGWSIAGTGDYNGDGKSDILWKNSTTNAAWIWEMNGTAQIASGSAGVGGAGWSILDTRPTAGGGGGALAGGAGAGGALAGGAGAGGALTVGEETGGGATDTAGLALLSQYAAAGFATAPDPGGATLVTDPAAQSSSPDPTWLTSPPH